MHHKITAVNTAPTTAPALARQPAALRGPAGGSSTPRPMVSHT